jgi:predicted transcriptional regulator
MALRTRIEITAQILEIAKDGAVKTRIMYGAYMSWNQLKEYLSSLVEDGLIDFIREDHKYKTTEKGIEYLKTIDKLSGMTSSLATTTTTASKEIIMQHG